MGISNEEIISLWDDNEEGCRLWSEPDHGPEGYVMIGWPEIQNIMDEDWFDEECFLDITDRNEDCSYWVPQERIIKEGA